MNYEEFKKVFNDIVKKSESNQKAHDIWLNNIKAPRKFWDDAHKKLTK